MPFLLKSEPDVYSFDDLLRDGETTWDGVTNPTALKHMREMKTGERLVIYHSNVGKAAVGLASVVRVEATDLKAPVVRIEAGDRLARAKTLAEMREQAVFEDSVLLRQFRLSVVPLTEAQYDWILHG